MGKAHGLLARGNLAMNNLVNSNSVWDLPKIEDFFGACVIPIRLAVMTPNDAPVVCSLWYLWDDGALWCATQRDAKVAKCLSARPRCGFEVAPDTPPYKGVRGQGVATVSADNAAELLQRLLDRFEIGRESRLARWLLGRTDTEVAIRIEPIWMTAWDYSPRMEAT